MAAVPEGFSAERNDSAPQRSGARKGRIVAEEREKADSPKKEIKLATSLEKAKDELEKSRIKLAALRINYDKKRNKFEKQNAKGKLSPNAVASHAKILNNLSKKIANEQSKIEKLEKFISQKI